MRSKEASFYDIYIYRIPDAPTTKLLYQLSVKVKANYLVFKSP